MASTHTSEQELLQLAEAFNTFNLVSSQLEASYSSLEQRMSDMRRQLRDANQGRRAEAQNKRLIAQRLRDILEALPGGVVVIDRRGGVTECNSRARGWMDGLTVGANWQDLSEKLFETQLTEHGDLVLADGRRLIVTQQNDMADGGSILLLTDITEQRRVDEVLVRHQRLATLGETLATLAHQVRTPVTSALLYSSTAIDPNIPEEKRCELIRNAIGCLSDLEALISDMLEFAGGHAAKEDGKVVLSELLACVERDVRPMLQGEQILNVIVPTQPCWVRGNHVAMASAVQNLVVNALQAAGEAAVVNVSVAMGKPQSLYTASLTANSAPERTSVKNSAQPNPRQEFAQATMNKAAQQQLQINVSDNGPGVPTKDAEKIFEPFHTSRSGGTGLGLAVARSVIRAHQGDIHVAANSRGGATFTVTLPIASTVSAEDANT